MAKVRLQVSLDDALLRRVDRLVQRGSFASRSDAVQRALQRAVSRPDRRRLARECAKLDPREERRLAEEAMRTDAASWPA